MFDDKEAARHFFKRRSAKAALFGKMVGFQIATIMITPDDGVASEPEQNNFGHFTSIFGVIFSKKSKILNLYCLYRWKMCLPYPIVFKLKMKPLPTLAI